MRVLGPDKKVSCVVKRRIIEIDEELCDGCGNCVVACQEGAIGIVDGRAKVINDRFCDGLGACIGECPRGALRIMEREAQEFDPGAVDQHLSSRSAAIEQCCSTPIMLERGVVEGRPGTGSMLTHWPIQIMLVPADAPFFDNADLLIAADCTGFAYPDIQGSFMKNRVLLAGCPKLYDTNIYVEKLQRILEQNEVRSMTILHMEVPCCSRLEGVVRDAQRRSGRDLRVARYIIGIDGQVRRTEDGGQ